MKQFKNETEMNKFYDFLERGEKCRSMVESWEHAKQVASNMRKFSDDKVEYGTDGNKFLIYEL